MSSTSEASGAKAAESSSAKLWPLAPASPGSILPACRTGLCRSIFAGFLHEASALLGRTDLAHLAEHDAALGRLWSDLAEAALPEEAPLLREARLLYAQKAPLRVSPLAQPEMVVGM